MKRVILASAVAGCFCLGVAVPRLAAQTPVAGAVSNTSAGEANVTAAKPAQRCLSDLRVFDSQMEKDGYWLGAPGHRFGSPMARYSGASVIDYQNVRPGYEIRTLVASAVILARNGRQQPCEDVLTATRDIYKVYVAEMHKRGVPAPDVSNWREQQIATAHSVAGQNTSFRSDELLGVDVSNAQNEALGSVEDLVMNARTGKIVYLVIGRGGIFGIDEKYVPIPWDDFKITENQKLLVLDVAKATMDAAPEISHGQFTSLDHFDQQSQSVDAYWQKHLSNKINN
jgi:sporulation protein YlmC with PRC-barrel domain